MRPVWKKRLILIGATALLLIAAAKLGEFALIKWWESGCNLIVYSEHQSPDGAWRLYVHQIDCGALSKFNTKVSIQPAGSAFAPFDYPAFFTAYGYDVPLEIAWLGDTTVEITIPPATDVRHQSDTAGEVAVVYRNQSD